MTCQSDRIDMIKGKIRKIMKNNNNFKIQGSTNKELNHQKYRIMIKIIFKI